MLLDLWPLLAADEAAPARRGGGSGFRAPRLALSPRKAAGGAVHIDGVVALDVVGAKGAAVEMDLTAHPVLTTTARKAAGGETAVAQVVTLRDVAGRKKARGQPTLAAVGSVIVSGFAITGEQRREEEDLVLALL
jgi:hypothetical protein